MWGGGESSDSDPPVLEARLPPIDSVGTGAYYNLALNIKKQLMKLPSYRDWTTRLNMDYIRSVMKLVPNRHIRKRTLRLAEHGPEGPVKHLEQKGIKACNFRCPGKEAVKLLRTDPEAAYLMLKAFAKMIFAKGAARMLPQGLRSLIYEMKIISNAGFVAQREKKARWVANYAEKPRFRQKGTIPRELRVFSLNRGYDWSQTTMGFHGVMDKAIRLLAHLTSAHTINLDLKSAYYQLPQSRSMIHHQVKVFALPMSSDPLDTRVTLVAFPLMGLEMGNAQAAAAFQAFHLGILRGMDLKARRAGLNHLSLPSVETLAPEHYPELKRCDLSLKDFLDPWRRDKKLNNDRYVHIDHVLLAMWRTHSDWLPLYGIHIDDVAITHNTKETTAAAGKYVYEEYRKMNIITSTKFDMDEVQQVSIITGTEVDHLHRTLSLPQEKWSKFTFNVNTLVRDGPQGVKAGFALEVIGQVMHATEIFPSARPSFVPLSHFMGGLAQMSQHHKRKWAKNMDKYLVFPPVLCRMLEDGWKKIVGRSRPAIDLVRIACDATVHVHCDWCKKGMGYVDLLTGDYEGVEFPDDHEIVQFYGRESLFGELFTVTTVLELLIPQNAVVALGEDNMGCIFAIQNWKSHPTYAPLALYYAQVVREKNITVVPYYVDTNSIIADPISRIWDRKYHFWDEFRRRLKLFNVQMGERRCGALDRWTEVFGEVMAVRKRYSRRGVNYLYCSCTTI